jgi:sulfur relay (sulfurtransferase) complex TusBCD TusD component (DsrE family)
LPSIADKTKHEVVKHSCKNNAYSRRGVMWQTDAIGLRKCDLGLSFHLLSLRQLQQ